MPNSDKESKFIGPMIPKNVGNSAQNSDSDSSSDDEFGVALPPGFQLNTVSSGSSPKKSDESSSKSTGIGPSMPPGFSRKVSDESGNEEDDDDDDDEMLGPLPEGMFDKRHDYDVYERLRKDHKDEKREKWMLEPPKNLKKSMAQPQTKSVTQFSQRSSKSSRPLTEEERREIISNRKKEEKIQEYLNEYKDNDSKRSLSLMEQHKANMKQNNKKLKAEQSSSSSSSAAKPERRPFDPQKDLNDRSMDSKKRTTFVRNTTDSFSSRFSSGRFQKFL